MSAHDSCYDVATCGSCLGDFDLAEVEWVSPGLYRCWDCIQGPVKVYAVLSDEGVRVWHADDEQHARDQHHDPDSGVADEIILDVYEVEHDPDCACFL